MKTAHPFDRYASLTDIDALKDLSAKPLRKSMRVNTLKCTPEEFTVWAKAAQWKIDPIAWCKEGFFVDREDRSIPLGKDLLHILGFTYMQEAASMLPPALLAVKPGDTVLDMSAAPGSKTTQLGAMLQNQGVLIANDVQEKRLWALLSNMQRCGLRNTIVTQKVGQWFSKNMTGRFDAVLCDAPCTAQGTVRKDSDALSYCSEENTLKMARLQRDLLESAIHAAKVGGRIVYSTCTLTPEENEGVILSALNKFGDQIEVLDTAKELGFGLEKAVEDSYRVQEHLGSKELYPMYRLWPQRFDTEGFFAAVLRKRAPTRPTEEHEYVSTVQDPVPPTRRKEIGKQLEDWYGAAFLTERDVLFPKHENLWVTTEEVLKFKLPTAPYMLGLPFGKPAEPVLRIAHEIATLLGRSARKQVVTLTMEELKGMFSGRNIPVDPSKAESGDVLLSIALPQGPLCIGRALFKNGVLQNRLPREIVRMFS